MKIPALVIMWFFCIAHFYKRFRFFRFQSINLNLLIYVPQRGAALQNVACEIVCANMKYITLYLVYGLAWSMWRLLLRMLDAK